MIMKSPVLISACLLGIKSRYDGTHALRKDIIKKYSDKILIPVCPEQLGGLPTPRPRAEICGISNPPLPPFPDKVIRGQVSKGGMERLDLEKASRGVSERVVDENGRDVTKEYIKGAKEILKIAKRFKIKKAVLKEKSPSCGAQFIYRNGKLVKGTGITARLLKDSGIAVEGVK